MVYYKVEYRYSLFGGGVAYIKADDKKDAINQCKRKRSVEFNMETLKRISKVEFIGCVSGRNVILRMSPKGK